MLESSTSSKTDSLLFILVSAVWGGGFVAISYGLDLFPPLLYAALRYDSAAIFVGTYAVLTTDDWWPNGTREWMTILVSGVFIVAIDNALLFTGQQSVTSAVASIVVALTPILAVVFARGLLPDEPVTRRLVIALILGIIGIISLAAPSPTGVFDTNSIGVLLILAATASVAFGSVVVRRLDGSLPPAAMTAWSGLLGAILLHLISWLLFNESVTSIEWTASGVFALTYLGSLSSGVGPFIYFTLLDRIDAIRSNLVSYTDPVFAASFGWLFLGETTTLRTFVGFAIILVGFLFVARDK